MTTPDELIERAAREYWHYEDRIWDELPPGEQEQVFESLRPVIRVALEAAIKACERQSGEFASDEYATPQPLGSISERFTCAQCSDAIRALLPQEDGE